MGYLISNKIQSVGWVSATKKLHCTLEINNNKRIICGYCPHIYNVAMKKKTNIQIWVWIHIKQILKFRPF